MYNPTHYFITIEKKFLDQQAGLFIDTTFRPGWHATVTGKIASCPPKAGLGLKEGDEVAFSYRVVYDQQHTDNADKIFYEDESPSPFLTIWSNKLGQVLVRKYMMNDKFSCALIQVEGNKKIPVEEVNGNYSTVESFLGKFDFWDDTQIRYNNVVTIDGKDYWKVKPEEIYAKKDGDDIEMLNKTYLLKEIKVVTEETESGIIKPFEDRERDMQAVILHGRGVVTRGDRVLVDRDRVQHYRFWEQDYLLVKERQLLAKVA